jgi:hypothetical protein
MPLARITVTSVTDEGHHVAVWGVPEHGSGEPVWVAFPTKGDDADVGLADRASRLARGAEVMIDYTAVTDGWNVARGLSVSS